MCKYTRNIYLFELFQAQLAQCVHTWLRTTEKVHDVTVGYPIYDFINSLRLQWGSRAFDYGMETNHNCMFVQLHNTKIVTMFDAISADNVRTEVHGMAYD